MRFFVHGFNAARLLMDFHGKPGDSMPGLRPNSGPLVKLAGVSIPKAAGCFEIVQSRGHIALAPKGTGPFQISVHGRTLRVKSECGIGVRKRLAVILHLDISVGPVRIKRAYSPASSAFEKYRTASP
jgi:hypothetical protein